MRTGKRQGLVVNILNLHHAYRVSERLIKKLAYYILKNQLKLPCAELSFVFLTDRKIKALNKRYKNEDRPTDVLSFDLSADRVRRNSPLMGEIIISIDKARKNSKIFATGFEEEFVLYIIHGILHLSGYDDESSKERARMESKQREILKVLCKRENLSKVLTPR